MRLAHIATKILVNKWASPTSNICDILNENFRDLIQAKQGNVGRCMIYEVVVKSPANRPSLGNVITYHH
jgi:hypothetical protein